MMPPFGLPLLADENVGRGVELGRVVLTHDTDFGMLAVQSGEPVVGIICLRPGHILPNFVLDTIRAIESAGHEVEPPFILVAERRADQVRVRVRRV